MAAHSLLTRCAGAELQLPRDSRQPHEAGFIQIPISPRGKARQRWGEATCPRSCQVGGDLDALGGQAPAPGGALTVAQTQFPRAP